MSARAFTYALRVVATAELGGALWVWHTGDLAWGLALLICALSGGAILATLPEPARRCVCDWPFPRTGERCGRCQGVQ